RRASGGRAAGRTTSSAGLPGRPLRLVGRCTGRLTSRLGSLSGSSSGGARGPGRLTGLPGWTLAGSRAGGGDDADLVLVAQVALARSDHLLARLHACTDLGPPVILQTQLYQL